MAFNKITKLSSIQKQTIKRWVALGMEFCCVDESLGSVATKWIDDSWLKQQQDKWNLMELVSTTFNVAYENKIQQQVRIIKKPPILFVSFNIKVSILS